MQQRFSIFKTLLILGMGLIGSQCEDSTAQETATAWRTVNVSNTITRVAPWSGIVFWNDNDAVDTDAIQLEYSYVKYNDIVRDKGVYDWTMVETLLDQAASRGHQQILRFYFIYPGEPTTVPDYIKQLSHYKEITAKSEGNPTGFVDWSAPEVQQFALDFYSEFAARYDQDPRLAYLQTGFGLWAEYHIYDGPWKMGQTFPTKQFQTTFLNHLAKQFRDTPWMISIDAADTDYTPFDDQPELLRLNFGVFDDSFLCKPHAKENAKNWAFFGRDRWERGPGGGEFSYYNKKDQKLALSASGPNGRTFQDMASEFHLTFIIGNDQSRYQPMPRIAEAGMAIGYRMTISDCQTNGNDWRIKVTNSGIAPMYHDAFVAIGDRRSATSLKGLLPGKSAVCEIAKGGSKPDISIQSDRLVNGQTIPFEAK
ncbi:hypothetical protein Poly51_24110 [Rubripirellula tenax]|uniref:DUF4832 domain-containing protein n=1 Tax=Rubripirellula tenax TaxID=2528015 RepID=A0A5C6F7C9_9BACT|nr:DUF4832 domain-containing protein [Rubripirellula tenax]TWU56500.1 hypothetical protein Poly51_24110 [Rubripirellula tenax]